MSEARDSNDTAAKAEWRKPELSRIAAGEAEGNLNGVQTDGLYTS